MSITGNVPAGATRSAASSDPAPSVGPGADALPVAPAKPGWTVAIACHPAAAMCIPTETIDAPAEPISVSLCARLPTRNAVWNRPPRVAPALASSWAARKAARTCPRICASPTSIESRPQTTENRWLTARAS